MNDVFLISNEKDIDINVGMEFLVQQDHFNQSYHNFCHHYGKNERLN